ncbi:type VI secretion system tip protein TssI/VgrG [Variovorax sp. CCNWLW225]|jgi:type VI secretion system secreted protein VgrG|uniref:type VI secretion system Vgr family protein n=1 Tax=Variovorax sp. CCNWLW225 TaxID=3127462 RepID=UPI00307723C4
MSVFNRGRKLAATSNAMPTFAGMDALEPMRVEGEEALSRPYSYTITLITPESADIDARSAANVKLKPLIGEEFSVHILLDGRVGGAGQERHISGLVTRARFLRLEGKRALYEVVIEPWLGLAQRTRDFKIFQNNSVLDTVNEVLGAYGFPLSVRTTGSYPAREFVVQYGETDYDFVSRLLHEWGLYYYFEHGQGSHTMVIVDDMQSHRPFPAGGYQRIPFSAMEASSNEEHCHRFRLAEGLQSGRWVTGDFDFTRPKANLMQTRAMPRRTQHSTREVFAWPGNYVVESEGEQLARARMEEAGAPGQVASGAGNLRGVATGHRFTLVDHPQDSANADYLVTAARLFLQEAGDTTGQEEFQCNVEFEVIPASNIFRPNPDSAKPRTAGPQTAVVTGPAGREIWTDQYGRVKLSFHWNRYCTKDENSSCWVRVSSPWAGTNFGGMQIPRIGQEVVVDFEYGDPDRPIITGRVYNADNMPPWELPGNATQSGLLSRSSEGGTSENANALRFEDKKGEEQLWLHAEKDQLIEVENDEVHTVGRDRTKTVDHDETNHIKNNRTETVDRDETITVHGKRTETVDGNETVTVKSDRSHSIIGTEALTVTGDQTHTAKANRTASVTGNQSTSVMGTDSLTVTKARTVTAQDTDTWSVTLGQTTTIGQAYTVSAKSHSGTYNDAMTLNVPAGPASATSQGDFSVTSSAANIYGTAALNVGLFAQAGDFSAVASDNVGVSAEGGTLDTFSSGAMTHASPTSVVLNVEGTTVEVTPGRIVLRAGSATLMLDDAGVTVNGTKIFLNC